MSIFDLIHNRAFGETAGAFNLRERFEELRGAREKLRLLCEKSRPEFLCQLVTGLLLSDAANVGGTSSLQVASVKGGDLLRTPVSFYQQVFSEIQYVQAATNDLFSDVLKGDFRLKEVPYPVSLIIYLSLRWLRDKWSGDQSARFTVEQLNRLFSAVFWRNVFTNRYDQGFLTKLSTDIAALRGMLERNARKSSMSEWASATEDELTTYFASSHKAKTVDELQDYVLDGGIQGAIRQAIVLYLNSTVTEDLLSGEELDRFSDKGKNSVDLHHIFPRQWLADNHLPQVQVDLPNPLDKANSLANLMPLSADSNKKWKTRAPNIAIQEFNLQWILLENRFDTAGIDKTAYDILSATSPSAIDFWRRRAETISARLHKLQFVAND